MLPDMVIHTVCGEQLGWYDTGKEIIPGVVSSMAYTRMDGTHPEIGERFCEVCPSCECYISSAVELKRIPPQIH